MIEWKESLAKDDDDRNPEDGFDHHSADVFGGDYCLFITSQGQKWEANVLTAGGDEVCLGTKLTKEVSDAKAYAEALFEDYIRSQLAGIRNIGEVRFVSISSSQNFVHGLTENGLVYRLNGKEDCWEQITKNFSDKGES
jgi:hypothetical protein